MRPYEFGKLAALKEAGIPAPLLEALPGITAGGLIGASAGALGADKDHRLQGMLRGALPGAVVGGAGRLGATALGEIAHPMESQAGRIALYGLADAYHTGGLMASAYTGHRAGQEANPSMLDKLKARLGMG